MTLALIAEQKPEVHFQDQIWELSQFQRDLGLQDLPEVMENPHTAALLQVMEDEVAESPEIVEFYARGLKNYKEGDPDSVANELAVIRDRIEHQISDGQGREEQIFTADELVVIREGLETGKIVYDEAREFFRMFKHVIPASKVPNLHVMRGSERSIGPSVAPLQRSHDAAKRMESRRSIQRQRVERPTHVRNTIPTNSVPHRAGAESTSDFSPAMIAQAHQALLTILSEKGDTRRNDAIKLLDEKFDLNDRSLAGMLVTAVADYENNSATPVFTEVKVKGSKVFARSSAATSNQ